MKQFVMQPLDELLNNENFVSRVRALEAQAGAKPSAHVDAIEEIATSLFGGGANASVNPNGIILISSEYPNYQSVEWRAGDTNALLGTIFGSFGGALGNSGVLIFGQAHDSTVSGLVGIEALDETGTKKASLIIEDTSAPAALDLRSLTLDSASIQALDIQSKTASSDSANASNLEYLDLYSKGTAAAGFGPAIAFRADNGSGTLTQLGALNFLYDTITAGSEDANAKTYLTVGGVQNIVASYINKWGMYNKYAYMSHEMTTQYINDWMSLTAGINGWDTAVIGAGTVALIADVANHHGIARTTQSGANTGCANYISTVGNYLITGNDAFGACFRTQTGTTDCEFRFGFNDTVGSATVDPVDGAYIHIEGVRLEGKTSNNSTRSTTGTTYTITTNTWYRMKILVNSAASTVNYYLYSAAGALLWTDSLSANIPTAAGREVGICINAYKTSAGTVNLIDVDWTAYWNEAVVTR